jgi:hypothetical protein
MLGRQLITFIEYLKRIPDGVIPDKQGLIDQRESAEELQKQQDKELLYELMARVLDTLPPEAQKKLNELRQNDPAGYENQTKQVVKQSISRPYANNVEG